MNTFVEEWSARAAHAAGVVFDFGGVISVAPSRSWALYPFCAARGLDRAAVAAGWTKYRHLWDGGFITFDEMYRRIFADAGRTATAADLAALWEVDAAAWIRDLRSEVKIPVAVHRSDLKHRDIDVIAIVIPKLRQFAEHHRHVPAVAFVCHAAVESTEMRGSKAHMLRTFLSERRGSPIGSQRFLVDSHRR